MAVILDRRLAANPTVAKMPRAAIALAQTIHSDLGGEPATITYSLDGRSAVFFETAGGPAKSVTVGPIQVPANATPRTDRVVLIEKGDTGMAQVKISQLIAAETSVRDSVTIEVVDVS